MWLLLTGLIVHIIFFMSVFDVYFKTPISHGMKSFKLNLTPLADRLVLFIADGLRADSFYDYSNKSTRAPFLRHVIENEGTWGVSHTSVPTESRPGHVAIIAGFYEDPSAIARGWKENPVEFDTVFNQSRNSWAWGSPDILSIFVSESGTEHIKINTYSSDEEDFASSDATKLDIWVFEEVEKFFKRAQFDPYILKKLKMPGNIFFLHLLATDTIGHSRKPQSEEYLHSIEIVDSGVQKMVKLMKAFYKDNKTGFLFTSDHGMTNWGSHGAGDPSETETPIVAWGAGFAPPQDPTNFKERMAYDARIEQWGLSHVRRHDIFQADLAPLISSVLGIPVPVNSVGTIPVEYLLGSDEYKAEALRVNALQMSAQYHAKQVKREKETLSSLFKPFSELLPELEFDMKSSITQFIKEKNYKNAIELSHHLIALCLKGIDYYHNYDRASLSSAIILAFTGWIVLVISHVLKEFTKINSHTSAADFNNRGFDKWILFSGVMLCLCGIICFGLLIVQGNPWQHYLYYLVPVFLWLFVIMQLETFAVALHIIASMNMVWEIAIRFLFIVVGVEILVLSFFVRPLLSVGLLCLACWPIVMHSMYSPAEKSMQIGWIGACILLASFTYMPVVGKEAVYILVEIAGIVAFVLISVGIYWCIKDSYHLCDIPKSVFMQGIMILTSVYLVYSTSNSISSMQGLPFINQLGAWAMLALSFIIPLYGPSFVIGRLLSVSSALLCPFLLLSIRHEVFYFVALTVAMFLWLFLEYSLDDRQVEVQIAFLKYAVWNVETERKLEWSDIRRAYFFLFFIFLSFFGIGNIASVNSFDPVFVYCFVTVFSPFVMGGLLLLKIIIPFLLVTCFFRAICSLLGVPYHALFYLFLLLSDLMAMHFFFLVTTEGSWLDIGTSLSHYVISMATTVFLILLMFIAKILLVGRIGSIALLPEERFLSGVHIERPHRD